MAVDPYTTFKNDQIKQFRRIDPAAVQLDMVTCGQAFNFLDMIDIDGGVPTDAGDVPCMGLIEDTDGVANGKVGPGVILRAIVPMIANGAIAQGQKVYPTSATQVANCPNNESKSHKCVGIALTGVADTETVMIYFQAGMGSINV